MRRRQETDVKRVMSSRRHLIDLLRRPPVLDRTEVSATSAAGLRSVDQVREMLDLVDRGLLSDEEFVGQRDKLLED
jgi:hypothetical protein